MSWTDFSKRWQEGKERRNKRPKVFNMWYQHPKTKEICKLSSEGLRGVMTIDENGVCSTCYGLFPTSEMYPATFYATKQDLLNAIKNTYEGMNI